MDSEGNVRPLLPDEVPKPDEIELTAEEAAVVAQMPKGERIGFYKAKRLQDKYRNAVFNLKPKSKHRKQPKSCLPKSLRRKRRQGQ